MTSAAVTTPLEKAKGVCPDVKAPLPVWAVPEAALLQLRQGEGGRCAGAFRHQAQPRQPVGCQASTCLLSVGDNPTLQICWCFLLPRGAEEWILGPSDLSLQAVLPNPAFRRHCLWELSCVRECREGPLYLIPFTLGVSMPHPLRSLWVSGVWEWGWAGACLC